MPTQDEKGELFLRLHAGPTFVIANAWDAGSAKMFSELGFPALATSSYAAAGVLGRADGRITREQSLAQAAAVIAGSDLPVSADLEHGFGETPSDVMDTIRLASKVGLVGGSIEDATGNPEQPLFPFERAIDRVQAAAEAVRSLSVPFVLTARCENFLRGNPDLDDTIRRLQAYERAGADVLFAPGLPDLAAVRAVCAAVRKPVNFMVALRGKSFSADELREAGVRRISLAASLYRTAMAAARSAASEALQQGTFGYLER
ncbi:MAG TPA: isocitrate lyase/phosphoenolpyruvate mutase family protein [Polyangiales bacterium]|nr:isocitrate lyase/phosphoenolpyruvate mutase family protein [Polyangiales bacterium]